MTVKEIIEKYLRDNGYDGLCCPDEECGCHVDDLIPCCDPCEECMPGYKGPDPSGDHDFLIYVSREDAEKAALKPEEKL